MNKKRKINRKQKIEKRGVDIDYMVKIILAIIAVALAAGTILTYVFEIK
jgi:hypothetical protein